MLIACLSTNISSINPLKLEVRLIAKRVRHILKKENYTVNNLSRLQLMTHIFEHPNPHMDVILVPKLKHKVILLLAVDSHKV